MNFIADAMLGSLAKRLRLLGFDVLYDHTLADNEILRLALEQGRVILTRDTGLAARPLARNRVLIKSDHVDDQVQQVLDAFSLLAAGLLTRCSICNQQLSPLDRDSAGDRVPEHVLRTVTTFFECRGCGRVYWEGSHVKNMAGLRAKKEPAT
ncbi:MAG: hypothetical protein HGB21_06340 [Nitrospirae bacterium]|nr:hypothetical protein [Nitrospirota bacterium]NTW65917.1 hypothetical protein [Nitrospirota bacterium]